MQAGVFTVKLAVRDSAGVEDILVKPDLIQALRDTLDISPEDFRRFVLVKEGTEDVIAFGTQYPDLSCVMLWNGEPFHILNYASIEDIIAAHEIPGEQILMWLDPVPEKIETEEELGGD
jgi:hypothetical protein